MALVWALDAAAAGQQQGRQPAACRAARQRQDIFKAEDEIMEKRDALIESLERRLAQRTETLFTIRWAVEEAGRRRT